MQRQTQLANDIWPLILPRIQAMITGAGSGSGGGGGAVNLAAHDLGGSLHTGTLRDSQAPQFLMHNGTRLLTGSLAVDTGVTIDGVDISAHAADINAHHAKLHGIIDSANHSVTGAQYQIVGLTAIDTLGLLTPSASPAANAIIKTDSGSGVTLVDLTVTSDLFVTGYLDFGTDTMHEDASYLQVTGSKAVRFGQNIGNANWTVYNTGGAQFGGNVDIISGGDLTVAGSGSYAGNTVLFADSSGGNVGIMMAPDSQFALDINGPARATYWIGPHAIQLKNVLLLSHFDGRLPYETNNTGEPNGHMGQVATVTGGVIYRPGKFYKALQCSVGTTNLLTNPSFETGTTGWGTDYAGTTTLANIAGGVYGSNQMVVYSTTQPSNVYSPAVSVSNSTSYAVSFWYKLNTAGTVVIQQFTNSSVRSSETLPATTEWTRYTKVITTTSTAGTIRIYVTMPASGRLDIDAVQVEQSNVVSPYCDGSLGSGHTWSGTAHASSSTRTASSLRYPVTGNINAEKGTIMLWVYADQWNPNTGNIWQAGDAAAEFDAFVDSSGTYIQRSNGANLTASGTLAVKTWHHLAITWDTNSNTRTVYVNGADAGSTTLGGMPTLDTGIAVGYNNHLGAIYGHIGYVDDFCILERVMPADEIRSVYESNAPVFAETSTFSFRPTPKGLIWADDEGLWMRDTAGSPVLGAYGGEAATKSWGGFTMAAGDIVLGRNAVGSSAIWWDQSAGTFGFYGSGSGTPQVIINADGTIGALNGNFSGTLAIGASGKITAGSTEISSSGVLLPRATISSGDDVFDTPNLSPGISVTQRYSDTAVSWPATDGTRNYAGNTLMRLYSSSEHYVPSGMAGGGWAHSLDGVIEAPSPTTPADSGLWMRRLWLLVGSKYLVVGDGSGASGVGINIYAPKVALHVGGSVAVAGDEGGYANATSFTNAINTTQSTGTGTVKMAGATSRNNVGFIKVYIGTTAAYIPYWTTITG